MSLKWFRRNRNAREHTLHDIVRGDVLGEGFERKDDAVPYDVEGEILDVLPGDVAATPQIGERAACQDEIDRGAWACAVADVLRYVADAVFGRVTRGRRKPNDVLHERRVDEDLVDFALQLPQTLGGHHGNDRGHAPGHPLDDD